MSCTKPVRLSFWKRPWLLSEVCTLATISAGHPYVSIQKSHALSRIAPQLTPLLSDLPPRLDVLMSCPPHTMKIQQAGQDAH